MNDMHYNLMHFTFIHFGNALARFAIAFILWMHWKQHTDTVTIENDAPTHPLPFSDIKLANFENKLKYGEKANTNAWCIEMRKHRFNI